MKNIILAALAAGLLIAGANTADAKRGSGHGHSHRAATFGLSRCHKHYNWRHWNYVKTRVCNSVHY